MGTGGGNVHEGPHIPWKLRIGQKFHGHLGRFMDLDLGMGKIEFNTVFDRGQCKLPDAFYRIKNKLPSQSCCIFKS